MAQGKLFSLTLMYIHYETDIYLGEVVDLFAQKRLRRLELGTLLNGISPKSILNETFSSV